MKLTSDSHSKSGKTRVPREEWLAAARAKDALGMRDLHFHRLFEQSIDAIYIAAPDGTSIEANQAWLDLFGYSREEVAGLRALDFYADPTERDDFLRRIAQHGVVRDEVRMKRKDGITFDCERCVIALKDDTGTIVALQGIHRDITERKRAEEALRKSEAYTRSILDALPIGVAVNSVDPVVQFEYMNDNFPRLYRTTREALAKPDAFWDVVYEDPEFRAQMKTRVLDDCASGDPERMRWQDVPIVRKEEHTTYVTARNSYIPERGLMLSTVWDATHRVEAERALRESENRFRSLFEQSLDAIMIARPDGTIVDVNTAWTAMFQYSREESAVLNAHELYLNPADRADMLRGIAESGFVRDEVRYKRKDGTTFDARRTVTALRDDSGLVVVYQVVIYDATALKQAEEQERQQRVFADAVMETSPACILVFNSSHEVVFANAETDRVLGIPRERVIGMTCGEDFTLLDTNGAPVSEGELPACRVLRSEMPMYTTEFAFDSPTGRRILLISAVPMHDDAGDLDHVVATIEDITARRQTEDALREVERRFRTLFDQSLDMVLLVDFDGHTIEVNPAATRLLGYPREHLLGLPVWTYLRDEERPLAVQLLSTIKDTGNLPPLMEFHLKRSDGVELPIEANVSLVYEQDVQVGIEIVARDITEREHMQEALRTSEREKALILESTQQIVAFHDKNRRLVWGNRAYLETVQCATGIAVTIGDVRGKHCYTVWGLKKPCAQCPVLLAISTGEPHEGEVTPENQSHWPVSQGSWLVRASPVRDARGALIGAIEIASDITKQKRLEAERVESINRVQRALAATVEAMGAAVEMRDPYTAGHQTRVTKVARAIANEIGWSDEAIEALALAGQVHDLGKLRIPAEILTKPGRLTESEFALIREHPGASYDLLKGIDFPWPIAEIAYQHHERLDGSGYPRGLKGDAILPEARVLAVADVFEAMASHRPYRPALGPEAALKELDRGRGTAYDSAAVDACVRLVHKKALTLG